MTTSLPPKKATGSIFAFSGVDENIDYDSQLVADLLDENCGLGLNILAPKSFMLWYD